MAKKAWSIFRKVSFQISWGDKLLITYLVLKDELETSLRLAGLTSLDQATPDLVNTLDVDYLVPSGGAESCPMSGVRAKL